MQQIPYVSGAVAGAEQCKITVGTITATTAMVQVGPLIPIQLTGLQVGGLFSAAATVPPTTALTVTATCSVLGSYAVTVAPGGLSATATGQFVVPGSPTPANGEDSCTFTFTSTTPADQLRFTVPLSSGIQYGSGPAITFNVVNLPTVTLAGASRYIEIVASAALPTSATLSLTCSHSGVQAGAAVTFQPGDIRKRATYTAPPSSGLLDHCNWRMVTTDRTIGTPSSFQVRSTAPAWAKAVSTNVVKAQALLNPMVLDQRPWTPTPDAFGCFFDETLVELVYTPRIQAAMVNASYAVTSYSMTFPASFIDSDVNLASIGCSAAPCTLSFVSVPLKYARVGDLLLQSTSHAEYFVGPIWLMAHPVDKVQKYVVTTISFQRPDLTVGTIRASVDHLFFVRLTPADDGSDVESSEAGQPFVYHAGATTDYFGETGELSLSGSFAPAALLKPGQQLWWFSVSTGQPAVSVVITDVDTQPGVLAVAQVPIARQNRPVVDGLIASANIAGALLQYDYIQSLYPQYWAAHPDFGAPLNRIGFQEMAVTLGHLADGPSAFQYLNTQAALATYESATG